MSIPEAPPFIVNMTRITSFAEADEILRNPEFEAGRFEEESLPFRGRTLLELDGDDHRQRRRMETPLFTRQMLDRYEHEVLEPAIEYCLGEAAAEGRGQDGVVHADLVRISHRMFLHIASAVIGLDDVDTAERIDLLEGCMYPLTAAFDVKYATRDHAKVIEEGLAAKERYIERFFRPSMERRTQLLARYERGEVSEEELPRDLLMIMVRHHGADWDDDLPAREAILFLSGATDTTSNAVNYAVVELLAWFETHPEDRDLVGDDAFLRGVCNETLRLHQNVTALARRATRDITLRSGRLVRRGESVAVDLVRANADREAFGDDADRFNPRRQVEGSVRPYGLTFGIGRHLCIGLPLVTTVSGKPAGEEGNDRAMLKILRALLEAGVELDPDRPIKLKATAEEVHDSLPILLTRP
jgi:cytochrome P450